MADYLSVGRSLIVGVFGCAPECVGERNFDWFGVFVADSKGGWSVCVRPIQMEERPRRARGLVVHWFTGACGDTVAQKALGALAAAERDTLAHCVRSGSGPLSDSPRRSLRSLRLRDRASPFQSTRNVVCGGARTLTEVAAREERPKGASASERVGWGGVWPRCGGGAV
jgi:hypothetical protein